MGRTPCCDKKGLKKGPWTPEEDETLVSYIKKNGYGSWRSLPKLAGIQWLVTALDFGSKSAYPFVCCLEIREAATLLALTEYIVHLFEQ